MVPSLTAHCDRIASTAMLASVLHRLDRVTEALDRIRLVLAFSGACLRSLIPPCSMPQLRAVQHGTAGRARSTIYSINYIVGFHIASKSPTRGGSVLVVGCRSDGDCQWIFAISPRAMRPPCSRKSRRLCSCGSLRRPSSSLGCSVSSKRRRAAAGRSRRSASLLRNTGTTMLSRCCRRPRARKRSRICAK